MVKHWLILLFLISSITTNAQNINIKSARNTVAELEKSVLKKESPANQIKLIKAGLKSIENAKLNRKVALNSEPYALSAFLQSYYAHLDDGDLGEQLLEKAELALDTAIKYDKEEMNTKYIEATKFNIQQKKVKLANAAFKEKNYESSLILFKDLSANKPTDTLFALNGAVSAIFLQRNTDAYNLMKRAADNHVLNISVYQFLGQWYEARFEIDSSIHILEQGLKLNPGNLTLNNQYINVLLNNKRYAKASEALKIALDFNPYIDRLQYLDGYVHQQRGNFKEATAAYLKAIRQNNYFFDAYYQLGLLKIDEFKLKNDNKILIEAEDNITRAYNLKPNDKNVINLLIEINTFYKRWNTVSELKRRLIEL